MLHHTGLRSTIVWSLLVLASSSGFSLELRAQPLGRLFTTSVQRTQIDNFKSKYNSGEKIEEEIVIPSVVPKAITVAPKPVMYNGIVKRSDGSTTVWVNGKLDNNATNNKNQSKNKHHHKITIDNNVIIKPAGSNTTVTLKPGQVWTPQTRQVIDPYQSSSVIKHSSNAKPSSNSSVNNQP